MKIRIKGNSVRLRLTKSEIDLFKNTGTVKEETNFGTHTLTYKLQRGGDGKDLSSTFDGTTVTVYMPEKMSDEWTSTEWVGYDNHMPLPDGQSLFLMVEKDFKCLDGTTEDQSDMFDNPLADSHK
ncbi:MAG TPA: hypothetical protein VK202_04395 [Bacteroidia bacterium]|nr:hypothetical protein [Bacteroidia bacterium]